MFKTLIRLCLVMAFVVFTVMPLIAQDGNPQVLVKTNKGDIVIELYPDKAPVGVENFLSYVKSGHYNNTVFHRVIKGFMIQGGGFDLKYTQKPVNEPIVNEANNGLKNDRGTLAYARTAVINSATCQFFINHKNNDFLNFKNETQQGYGYAVFGKVIKGMDVVDKIANVKTGQKKINMRMNGQIYPNTASDVPVKPVIIKSMTIVEK